MKSHRSALLERIGEWKRRQFPIALDTASCKEVVERAIAELLGHARVETTMVYLRRKNKALEMESVRGLSWGSVFPHNVGMPQRHSNPRSRSLQSQGTSAETGRAHGT